MLIVSVNKNIYVDNDHKFSVDELCRLVDSGDTAYLGVRGSKILTKSFDYLTKNFSKIMFRNVGVL